MIENKTAIKYWQYRKSKARKAIKDVALIGCPIFMTCSKELNEDLMKKKKEKLKWANKEMMFADMQIKELRKVV